MAFLMAFLGVTSACGFQSSASNNDAKPDAPPDASGPQFGGLIKVTFNSPADVPTTTPALTADVDTDTSPLCDKHNDQSGRYCVITGSSITLASGAVLRAHGNKPLVLLAITTVDLEGMIDVSSKHDAPPAGAGAVPSGSCLGITAAMGHSGGYGGSFGGQGGPGGTPVSTTGESGGMPGPAIGLPTELRGGCSGGDGAGNVGGSGTGGSGGGVVAIIASTSIHLNGQINASGAAGLGGTGNGGGGGGGGGGSGGMIILDAPLIDAGAGPKVWLYANGGGGGQGGTDTGTGSGAGDDGMESSAPMTPAPAGGNSNRSGGHGGDGSAGTSNKNGGAAMPAINNGGGGGGGGGAGFIRSPAIAGTMFAPDLTRP
jgi:hypothetical protein